MAAPQFTPTDPTDPPFRLFRGNSLREDGQSASLLIGKAAEHLACCELILSGRNAFMADAGQPYDILVDSGGGRFSRVSVKATTRMYQRAGFYPVYRFALRRSATRNRPERRASLSEVDVFAFVALDIRCVGWLLASEVTGKGGRAKLTVELKSRRITYSRRRGNTGNDPATAGRWIEDLTAFPVPLS